MCIFYLKTKINIYNKKKNTEIREVKGEKKLKTVKTIKAAMYHIINNPTFLASADTNYL